MSTARPFVYRTRTKQLFREEGGSYERYVTSGAFAEDEEVIEKFIRHRARHCRRKPRQRKKQ